jgi:hypothetical protein
VELGVKVVKLHTVAFRGRFGLTYVLVRIKYWRVERFPDRSRITALHSSFSN